MNVCSPLKSIDDVLNWKCENLCWAEKVCKINQRTKYCYSNYGLEKCTKYSIFPSTKLWFENVPKTLVCHDMKGGYLEDRFVHDTEADDPYRFFHWSYVDVFVYFSHYFVTIPPIGWINSGHLHGVSVLGTIITEDKTGFKICEDILTDKKRTRAFSYKLAEICQHYGFDGYLVNIENCISEELIYDLVEFVKILKDDLKMICSERDTLVIWYDSVIVPTGELKWQNKLNQHNKAFFDACDGIFLNYVWTKDDLNESLECAGPRLRDVYVGVDVFGRNCTGGFNTDKAVEIIRSFDLSVAIFAPGWTHELRSVESNDYIVREYNFWKKLRSFLYTHGPTKLPFRTTFCQGFGRRKFKEGDVDSEAPWFNLRKQNYQPTCCACTHSNEETTTSHTGLYLSCVSVCTDDAYEGGGCLKLSSCSSQNNLTHRLLACDFSGPPGCTLYYVTIAYRFLQDDGRFTLTLLVEEKDLLEIVDVTKCNKTSVQYSDKAFSFQALGYRQSGTNKLHLQKIAERSVDHPNGWRKSTFRLTHGGDMAIREVCTETSQNCSVLLGLLEITVECDK